MGFNLAFKRITNDFLPSINFYIKEINKRKFKLITVIFFLS